MCVLHMCENYGHHTTIVFDGYDISNLTKGVEQWQRAAQVTTGDFLFELAQKANHQRSSFLTKQRKQIQTDIKLYDWDSQAGNPL